MIFWLLLMTGSGPEVIGNEIVARLDSYFIIDVCGNRKEALLLVEIGPVAISDSLIGFDFEVSFDSTKFKFSPVPIKISTMAEFFENVNISPVKNKGDTLVGWGVNLSLKPIAGNGRLIGFIGDYIGPECPDTNIVKFENINFNEEFKKEVIGYEDGKVVTIIKDEDNRLLYVDILTDSLKFKDTTIAELTAEITTSDIEKLEFIEFEIEIADADNYDVSEIKSVSGNIEITDVLKQDGKFYFTVNFTGDISENEKITLIINEVIKDSLVTSLKINPIKVNDCACITNLKGDSSFLESFKAADTSSNVVLGYKDKMGEIQAFYDSYNDRIVIKSENNIINKVDIYDLQGRIVRKYTEENFSNHVEFQNVQLDKGVYFLIVTQSNMKIYKIVLVINYFF